MATKKRSGYFASEEGIAMRKILQLMSKDSGYNTADSYSIDNILYPNNLIPFEDKHMNYLNNHPLLEADKYIANIKLRSRIR